MILFRGGVAGDDLITARVGRAVVPSSLRPVDKVSYMWYRRVIDCRVRLNLLGGCLDRILDSRGARGVRVPTGQEVGMAVEMYQNGFHGYGVPVDQVDDGSPMDDDLAVLLTMSREIRCVRRAERRKRIRCGLRAVRGASVAALVRWWRMLRR